MTGTFTSTGILDKNRPRTVVFYGRVSTEHEAQLSALENQMQWYDDMIKYHPNWKVIDKYIDEGITGTQAKKRPAFLKMIEDAKAGKFDLIVTREVCRFARNTVDTLTYTRELKNLGVEVFFVEDNIWTMDGDGELRLSLMATLAQEESRKVSERVKAGQKISRDKGVLYGSGNILGYERVNGTYVINSEQADTVRMIFDLYERGFGEKKISSELCKLHRKSANGEVKWDAAKIGRILKNATYKGYIGYYKSHSNNYLEQKRIKNHDIDSYILVKGDFESIVSEEQWDRCDEIRRSKVTAVSKNGKKVLYGKKCTSDVWLRKMKCKCGSPFHKNKWRKNKRGDDAYGYQCYNQKNNGSKTFREQNGLDTDGYCDLKMVCDWKLDLMAKEVFENFWKNKKDDALEAFNFIKQYAVSETKENNSEILTIDRNIDKLRNRLENMIEMRADGELTKEEYAKSKSKIETEINSLTNKKAELTSSDNNLFKIDLEKIKSALNALVDLKKIDSKIIDIFVSEIIPIDNDRFEWTIRLSENKDAAVICNVGGRKTNPTVSIEGESPLTYDFCFIDIAGIKKTYLGGVQHRLLLKIGISQKFTISWDLTITYEMAKAYRKAHGGYLRENQWEDITMMMCLEIGK